MGAGQSNLCQLIRLIAICVVSFVHSGILSADDQAPEENRSMSLYGAAERSQVETLKRLIAEGADVNQRGSQGATPLHRAALRGPIEAVEVLINAGAELDAVTGRGLTPIGEAARAGHLAIVRVLLEAGADANGGRRMTPLVMATQRGHVEVIRLLVEHGANVNDSKNPPIHWAGVPEAAEALISAGADVNIRDAAGETALHLARRSWSPNAEAVAVLIEHGADVNARSESGRTPLHEAIRRKKPEIVNALIEAGADVDARDNENNTPLYLAMELGEPFLETLLAAGATDDGYTELQRAARGGELERVNVFIDDGANVNERGPLRTTAIHLASAKGHVEVVDALIRAGADIHARDTREMTPLHVAANAPVAERLIAAGAPVDERGMQARAEPPLFMAVAEDRPGVVNVLVQHGARIEPSFGEPSMLTWAAFFGRVDVVRVLLDHGARTESAGIPTEMGGMRIESPLHVVASGGLADMHVPDHVTPEVRLQIAQTLIDVGADVNVTSNAGYFDGFMPIHGAAGSGHVAMIHLLLKHGADVNAAPSTGMYAGFTPLHAAARRNHAEAVELLLKRGADVHATTTDAYVNGVVTPLELARRPAVRELLIEHINANENN